MTSGQIPKKLHIYSNHSILPKLFKTLAVMVFENILEQNYDRKCKKSEIIQKQKWMFSNDMGCKWTLTKYISPEKFIKIDYKLLWNWGWLPRKVQCDKSEE